MGIKNPLDPRHPSNKGLFSGEKWTTEKCRECGGRIVATRVLIRCENYKEDWRTNPDACDFILCSG